MCWRPLFSLHAVLLLGAVLVAQEERWWAYRRLERPAIPQVADPSWSRTPIDRFVLARLEAEELTPAAPADRHALLRRITYDLTGLPPTQAEIADFVNDRAPDAYERVVERLLASKQYGVKWGRHWLDLVRYAETDGYERDNQKPYIWRYRDWVVDAFNSDMPYGEFLAKQLAGDEMPRPTVADRIATGYYRLGIWDDEPTDREQARYDDLDGIADTTARVMLGISMGCARCHDHKKDPLPQRDYYSFLAFFENLRPYDLKARTVPVDGAEAAHARAVALHEGRARELRAAVTGLAEDAWHRTPAHARERLAAAARDARVAYFPADELHATELRAATGEVHGKIEGQIVEVDGRVGRAMRFDGDDAAVLPRLVEDSFTVAFFVRSTSPGEGRVGDPRWFLGSGLVDGEVPGIVRDWGISWHSKGRIAAGVGRPETFVASEPGYHDGHWHHVAFTRDRASGRIALYVDGVLVDEAKGNRKPLDSPPRIVVGRMQPGGKGFRGDLDELAFYPRALSAEEVVALALDLRGGAAAPGIIRAAPSSSESTTAGVAGGADERLESFRELAALRPPRLETIDILAVRDRNAAPKPSFVRLRGNVHAVGERVEPAFPAVLQAPAPRIGNHRRRTALAEWIVSDGNPLTWRVIANRVWQHHFGRGLSREPNDFGRLGEAPTHPRLLDWLACEVKETGGRLKAIHRLIVTSATYRMASTPNPAAFAVDPRNDRFWRFDRRRLTAEEIRDSFLMMSGELNPELGGPWVYPPLPAEVLATASRPGSAWGRSKPDQAARRSLYVHSKRSLQEPLLAAFDKADTDNSCPVRFATVQATQALVLLNGDFAQERAARFARRLAATERPLREQLAAGLRHVTQRPAREGDVGRLLALHRDLVRDHGRTVEMAMQRCCLVLLNCNEMIYID
ncbi:MAG: DUF1549 domain-containing protein [bacterium]|nr:DUF1549 domain-containing protein [bacterium]